MSFQSTNEGLEEELIDGIGWRTREEETLMNEDIFGLNSNNPQVNKSP
jgi:hypothetical protein